MVDNSKESAPPDAQPTPMFVAKPISADEHQARVNGDAAALRVIDALSSALAQKEAELAAAKEVIRLAKHEIATCNYRDVDMTKTDLYHILSRLP